jgi:hypothetical protein
VPQRLGSHTKARSGQTVISARFAGTQESVEPCELRQRANAANTSHTAHASNTTDAADATDATDTPNTT